MKKLLILSLLIPGYLTLSYSCKEPSQAQVPPSSSEISVKADPDKKESIKWLTIQEAEAANKAQPKKIIIDVYTDWCGPCKRMDATTFKDETIVKYINENFHPVKLDAEHGTDIVFNGKTYKNTNPGRKRSANELAAYLLNGELNYPTIVYLDEQLKNLGPVQGFMDAESIEPVLHYFAENHYKTTSWEKFKSGFKGELNK